MNRPQSLREVAERAEDLKHFGYEFADWLHTVRATHSRKILQESISEEPPSLAERFSDGKIADAWLAAYAAYTAERANLDLPEWANDPSRIAPIPWFSVDGKHSRLLALRDSPPAFKNRNLFTPRVDLPLRLRAGRPPVSAAQKRQKNLERQRRFRARQKAERTQLRSAQSK
jgi:hypothetical protein